MDHLRFQSSQAAAAYVADSLDPQTQEAFELHMMSCPECVGEVESWRALKANLPAERHAPAEVDRKPGTPAAPTAARGAVLQWRLAATIGAVAVAAGAGGWYAHTLQSPWSNSDNMAFFNLPAVTRGPADCLAVRLDPRTQVVALHVPGAVADQQLVAVDSDGRDLNPDSYAVRTQSDGTWVVRLRSSSVSEQGLRFEARSADGTVEPRGCVLANTGE
jgi:anti-sigma factor RsiW